MMSFNANSRTCAFLLAIAFLSGCGGNSVVVDSGLPPDKKANELTTDEADQLCDATVETANTELAAVDACKLPGYTGALLAYASGASDEDIQAACQESYDDCEESGAGDIEFQSCNTTTMAQESCEMTVAQYEACTADQIQLLVDGYGEIPSCGSITAARIEADQEATEGEEPQETSAACQEAEAACPDGF